MNPHRAQNRLHLLDFDTGKIFTLLETYSAPVMEVDLLKTVTGEQRIPSGRERLFELHFSFCCEKCLGIRREPAGPYSRDKNNPSTPGAFEVRWQGY